MKNYKQNIMNFGNVLRERKEKRKYTIKLKQKSSLSIETLKKQNKTLTVILV